MKLQQFLSNKSNKHYSEGNPSVLCNALYKKEGNLNCYLTAPQAVEFARHLLEKAQIIMENDITDGAVQVWNEGASNERIYFGLIKARIGPRRKKLLKKSSSTSKSGE